MPKKAVGTNPLFSSRGGVNKIMTGKTDKQNTKKVKEVSDFGKITPAKLNPEKNKKIK